MHRILVCLAAIGILAIGCNDGADAPARKDGFSEVPKTKEDSLYHDVMEGHDVGMVKIGKVRKYSAQVKQSLDSLNKLGERADHAAIETLEKLQKDLHDADSSMYKWMEDFKADSATGNTELRINYLQHEKEKVTKVKEAILGSLQRADSLFARKS